MPNMDVKKPRQVATVPHTKIAVKYINAGRQVNVSILVKQIA